MDGTHSIPVIVDWFLKTETLIEAVGGKNAAGERRICPRCAAVTNGKV